MRDLEGMDVMELCRLRSAVDEVLTAKRIAESASKGEPPPTRGDGGEVRSGEGTLRREKVRCGKKACKKCADGPSHGPYWYLYYYRKGKLASRYLGKDLPEEFRRLLDPKAEEVPPGREKEVREGRDRVRLKLPPADPRPTAFGQDELPLFTDG